MKLTYKQLVAANQAAEETNQRRVTRLEKIVKRLERVCALLLAAVALGCVWEIGRVAVAAVKVIGGAA